MTLGRLFWAAMLILVCTIFSFDSQSSQRGATSIHSKILDSAHAKNGYEKSKSQKKIVDSEYSLVLGEIFRQANMPSPVLHLNTQDWFYWETDTIFPNPTLLLTNPQKDMKLTGFIQAQVLFNSLKKKTNAKEQTQKYCGDIKWIFENKKNYRNEFKTNPNGVPYCDVSYLEEGNIQNRHIALLFPSREMKGRHLYSQYLFHFAYPKNTNIRPKLTAKNSIDRFIASIEMKEP